MNQVSLTFAQAAAISERLLNDSDLGLSNSLVEPEVSITRDYGDTRPGEVAPNDRVRCVVSQGNEVTAEFDVYRDGHVEVSA